MLDKEDGSYSMRLVLLLYKMQLAGLQKRSMTMASTCVKGNPRGPSKYCFKFAVVSLSLDYVVAVPYKDRDIGLLP